MAAPSQNDAVIRLRLDTGEASRDAQAFRGSMAGIFGGSMGGSFFGTAAAHAAGAPFGFVSRTASNALGTAMSTAIADIVEGPLAAARVMGRIASRESGFRAFAERTRAFFSGEEEVKDALGMAARGMTTEQIRAFAAPILSLHRMTSEGALRVEEALEGNGSFAKELAGGDPRIEQLLESGRGLAEAFGQLLKLTTELVGSLSSLLNLLPMGR